MKRRQNFYQVYNNALMNLMLRIGYPEFPGRTEDHPDVRKFAQQFRKTPEQVAHDLPLAAKKFYRPPTKKDYNLNLVDDFD